MAADAVPVLADINNREAEGRGEMNSYVISLQRIFTLNKRTSRQ